MKRSKTAILLSLLLITALGFWSWKKSEKLNVVYLQPVSAPMTMCGSFSALWSDTIKAPPAKILPGLGTLRYPITTTSIKAQEFFEQGLRLVYAFNHWEAIQAFKMATTLDPDCAMAYWGLALAFGPNLNDWNPTDRERIAFEAIQKHKGKKKEIHRLKRTLMMALRPGIMGRHMKIGTR